MNSLVTQALAHDGDRPGLGETMAMLIDLVAPDGSHVQPILVEV